MYRDFLKLTIPNILTNLTVPLVSLVDVVLMGHMGDSSYIIGIGLSVAIFNLMYWAFGFLRMGTTGLVAQAKGGNDLVRIHQVLIQGLIIATIVGLLFIVLQKPILSLVDNLVDVTDFTHLLIIDYFDVRIYAAPASISLFVINGWLLGLHKSKTALWLAVIINLVNIILSYILVQFFGLGIMGVAVGTVVAQYTGLFVGIGFIAQQYNLSQFFNVSGTIGRYKDWRAFIQVNGDLFVRTLCLLFTLTFFKVNAAEYGASLGAGNLLLLEFIGLSAYGIDGLAFAAESITGKYFGAGRLDLLKRSIKVAFNIGLSIGGVGSILFLLFGNSILHLLTDQKEVIDAAMPFLPWVIIAPFIHSFAFIWDGVYIGCTASKQMKWSLLISTFVVFLPSYYLFSNLYGNHGMWLSLTLFMLSRGLIQTILVRSGIFDRL